MKAEQVLVIKLGALGDVVQATGPFAAIRGHHPNAHITLLTAPVFRDFLAASNWFDEVWVDSRPSWKNWRDWHRLRFQLRGAQFDRVYDLQTSDRSNLYFHLQFREQSNSLKIIEFQLIHLTLIFIQFQIVKYWKH